MEDFHADLMALAEEKLRSGQLDRRGFLRAMSLLGVAAVVPLGAGAARAEAKEIVVCNFGGDALTAWTTAWAEPFTADTGIPVAVVAGQPTVGSIKAMVESGNITWDMTDGSSYYVSVLGKEGLIQPYDYSIVDKSKVRPEFIFEHGCSSYLYATLLAYDKEQTGGRVPRGYRDYLNFKDFPGKRGINKWVTGSLEAMLIGDGVEPDKVYPIDEDRVFGLLREYRDELILWGTGADSMQLFRDGEIVMGNMWSTRAIVLAKESDGRFTWTWECGVVQPSCMPVLNDNPAGHVVFDYIASMQIPERQIELFKLLGASPSNPAAAELMSPELREIDLSYEPNYETMIAFDTPWYTENYTRVQAKFLDVMAS